MVIKEVKPSTSLGGKIQPKKRKIKQERAGIAFYFELEVMARRNDKESEVAPSGE